MSILKNFRNPWEADTGVLQTDVLDTDVLNNDILNLSNDIKNRRGVVYYASTGNYTKDLSKAINEAKKLLRQNGITWLDFQLIDDGEESEFSVWKYPKYTTDGGIYDGAIYISRTGSYTYSTNSSMITYDTDSGGTSTEKDLGWKICHEIIHQYLMRLGWVIWGFEYYLQPHGEPSGDPAHLNYKEDGSLYLNMMMSGHFHNTETYITKSSSSLRKLVTYHKFILKNYISLMNLENKAIAKQFAQYFYFDGIELKYGISPYFDIRFMGSYLRRRNILNKGSYNSDIFEKNHSPFDIDPKSNEDVTPFFPEKLKQKIYV